MKQKIRMILLCVLFILPLRVDALTGTTAIKCDKTTITPGTTITCTLSGTATDGGVFVLSSKIKTSSNLTIETVKKAEGWQGDDEVNLDLYHEDNHTGTFEIATFTVKASNNITGGSDESITIYDTKFTDLNLPKVAVDVKDIVQNIKVTSTINTLSSISLSAGTLTPAFNKDVTNYSVSLDAEKVTINATKTDDKSTVSGNTGEVKLAYGTNTFKINVKSESGSTKTYTILITRPDTRYDDATLKSLVLTLADGQTFDLNTEGEYKFTVENDVDTIDVEATLNSSKAKFIDGYGPRTVDLKEGENEIVLKVQAENETTKTYALKITREKAEAPDENKSDSSTENTDKNDSTDNITEDEIEDIKTGSAFIFVIIAIAAIAMVITIYFYKQVQKKQVNNSEKK